MSTFLIFPNQLYERPKSFWSSYNEIMIVEEPVFFYDSIYKPFRPSKIKLAYLRACMKCYFDKIPHPNKKYIDYQSMITHHKTYDFLKFKNVWCFDTNDHDLTKKLKRYIDHIQYIESPNFVLTLDDLKIYHSRKTCSLQSLYSFTKNKLSHIIGDLIDTKSTDKMNRKNIPSNMNITIPKTILQKMNKYQKEATNYVERVFGHHRGSTDQLQLYPIDSRNAYISFQIFLEQKLVHFGDYQDAIKQNETFLFHSNISAALNIGLLDPLKLVKMTIAYVSKKNAAITINNIEGFLRQVIGWREYMRYLYCFRYEEMIRSNLPENTKRMSTDWFEGNTNILPFDREFKKCIETGYAHHIVRLMVFLNIFILNEIRPEDIYKWFMEIVCIDAYSWVMIPNIYAMGFFYNKATTRPYLCSSNYIVKMSDYKKNEIWNKKMDSLYHSFIQKKPNHYVFFYKKYS